MKILHVINSLAAGGAENLVVSIMNKQILTNDITLFTFHSEHNIFTEKLDRNINFYSHNDKLYLSIFKIKQLISLIKKHDIIHVHLFPPFYIIGIISIFFRKKKFIYTEHNTNNRRRKILFRGIEKFMYSNYDNVICISEATKYSLEKWVGNNVNTSVINNFVNNLDIQTTLPNKRKDLGFSSDSILLVMTGRFSIQKDQDTILKTLKNLPNQYELVLIGIGERLNELKEMALELDLSSRVHFMGLRKDVIAILKVCDYGILSSHWEGFGLAALEYISSGIIALGTNVDGLNEVIMDKECLFSVGDHQELYNKVITIQENDLLKQKIKKNQQTHAQNFDIDIAVKKHITIYNQPKC